MKLNMCSRQKESSNENERSKRIAKKTAVCFKSDCETQTKIYDSYTIRIVLIIFIFISIYSVVTVLTLPSIRYVKLPRNDYSYINHGQVERKKNEMKQQITLICFEQNKWNEKTKFVIVIAFDVMNSSNNFVFVLIASLFLPTSLLLFHQFILLVPFLTFIVRTFGSRQEVNIN